MSKAIILMYHRISSEDVDPWNLCVSPRNFHEQMCVLKQFGSIISLSEIQELNFEDTNAGINSIITFDDGYSDNFKLALPIIETFKIPVTIFVVSDYVGSKVLFYWDEIAEIFLKPGILPKELHFKVKNKEFNFNLGSNYKYSIAEYDLYKNWKIGEMSPPTIRHKLYIKIWQIAQSLESQKRDEFMFNIRKWSGKKFTQSECFPLSNIEFKALSKSEYVNIGGHTCNHITLINNTLKKQISEISNCRNRLRKLAKTDVTTFSYPHGKYNNATLQFLKESGFELSCTTMCKVVEKNDYPYKLPRIHIKNWNGQEFKDHITKILIE